MNILKITLFLGVYASCSLYAMENTNPSDKTPVNFIDSAIHYADIGLLALSLHHGAIPTKQNLCDILNRKSWNTWRLPLIAECINKGDYASTPLDAGSNTALMRIINNGEFDNLFEYLIAQGLKHDHPLLLATKESLNMQNNKGETALIIAAQRTDVDLIFAFLKNGANPNIQDNTGRGAIDYLHEKQNKCLALIAHTLQLASHTFSATTTTTRPVWLATNDDQIIVINYEQAEESTPLQLLLNNCAAAGTKKRPIKVNFSSIEVSEFIEALNAPTNSNTPDYALRFTAPGLYARYLYQQLPNNIAIKITQYYKPNLNTIKQRLIMAAKKDLSYVSNTIKKRIHALNNLAIDKVLLVENLYEAIQHNKHLHVYPNTSNYHTLKSLNHNEYTLFTEKLPLVIQDKCV